MTNGEKYRTANKREDAFLAFCGDNFDSLSQKDKEIVVRMTQNVLQWLDLEADDEKPLPCPFCGDPCQVSETENGKFTITCMGGGCFYRAGTHNSIDEAIAAHNRVARAVMAAKEKGEKQ